MNIMKKIITFIVVFGAISTVFSQDISGTWNGILKVQGMQLSLVFHIDKTENGFSSTMDSPDQKAFGIPVTTTSFENSKLKITVANARIEYDGILESDGNINGTFKQSGQTFPMNLSKGKVEKEIIKRPQEPQKPYSYYTEDVVFENKLANFNLAGTLSLPTKEGLFPAVILISGSGAQNRDEELLGHKPFLVISDYLTKNGIAVLRFDDRGTAMSKGDFKTATTLDFATDVDAAVQFFLSRKEIDKRKIGLIGHSEGGMIAPIVASKSKNISFIILLAGTGIPGDELLLLQQELIGRVSGISENDLIKIKSTNTEIFDIVKKATNPNQMIKDITDHITKSIKSDPESKIPDGISESDFIKMQVSQLASPWMQFFIKYNPALTLENVKCPVLALNGDKDLQVPSKENLEAINNALSKGGNKKYITKQMPNLNHLFQECKTGSPQEYSEIEQTISPLALTEILNWIQIQTKK
jgi:pimeloyl-ACP methyl ester carboxylesterase